MTIYTPVPRLSDSEKRLLQLLAELILESSNENQNSNRVSKHSALSDNEAWELLGLLETLVSSPEFRKKIAFIEGVSSPAFESYKRQYYEGRAAARKSTIMLSTKWSDFLHRLGRIQHDRWHGRSATMTFEHFLEMEDKLFRSIGMHPRVRSILMDAVSDQEIVVDDIRFGNRIVNLNIQSEIVAPVIEPLKMARKYKVSVDLISTASVVGIFTAVANAGVLFTTRDWDVLSVMSNLAANAAATVRIIKQ